MSLEFEYLLRKSRCEMLISRDDISNDVITIPLALAFNVCIHLQLFPLCAVWRKSDSELSCRRAIGELEVEFKFQRCVVASSPSFSCSTARVPRESLLAGWDIDGISNKLLSVRTAICKSVCHSLTHLIVISLVFEREHPTSE